VRSWKCSRSFARLPLASNDENRAEQRMKAITSTYKPGDPSLGDVLRQISVGEVQLPDFQRGWVWDDDHIRSLIASVSLSYPIGSVMLLQTGGEGAQFQPRLVQGVSVGAEVKPELLILDGQQRTTSLFQKRPKARTSRGSTSSTYQNALIPTKTDLTPSSRCRWTGRSHRTSGEKLN
jgi:hypothetical protein